MEVTVFIICSVIVLSGALGVLIARNPVHAALFLVETLFGIAVLFIMLDATFLAAVQVVVYAGAIVILFLFVIMLLGVDKAEDLDFAVAFARIECHYFINAIFVEEAYILKHVDTIQHLPTTIVQGRYDVVCPTRSAWELHQAMPESHLIIVPDAGHSMGEVSIARELVAATDALR